MTRLVDDRGRLLGKVNIVDIIVLVAIVAIVVFAAVRLTGGGAEAGVPVKVTFLDTRVDQALVAGMQNTGTITDTSGNVIGELQSIGVTPSVEELLTTDGQYKSFPSATKRDVSYVVLCQGTVSGSTVHVGRLAARAGAEVRIFGPGFEALTVITDVVWGAEALE